MIPRRTSPRLAAATAVLLFATGPLLSGCAVGRGIEALDFLLDIAAGPDTTLAGVTRIEISSGPGVEFEISPERLGPSGIVVGPGALRADLYLPSQGDGGAASAVPARAALVLVPGLAETGKDDARLVGLAVAFARVGIAVLVPDLASLKKLRAGPENIGEIANSLRFLAGGGQRLCTTWRNRGAVETDAAPCPIGVAAISYAVGPALLATLEPDLVGKVGFLVGVGGYHDIAASLTYITTGWYRDADGGWRRGTPNAYGKWAFVLANAARVADPADRTSLDAMARRRLADLDAEIDDLAAQLGPEGRAIHALVTNTERDRVAALIAALPESIRADLAALDLAARDLSAAPPALLLHGSDDTIIPASESVALAAALGPDRVRLVLLDRLAHADLEQVSLGDAFRLWRACYWLLAARDGAL